MIRVSRDWSRPGGGKLQESLVPDPGNANRIAGLSVPVAVMGVVDVGMPMSHGFVTVPVSVRRQRELLGRVVVLMVFVVGMLVGVLQSLVFMSMLMSIRGEQ